jgi:hypothetical protein
MPPGNSNGYVSARFVNTAVPEDADPDDRSATASKIVEEATTAKFTKHGIEIGSPNANLIIAYTLMS